MRYVVGFYESNNGLKKVVRCFSKPRTTCFAIAWRVVLFLEKVRIKLNLRNILQIHKLNLQIILEGATEGLVQQRFVASWSDGINLNTGNFFCTFVTAYGNLFNFLNNSSSVVYTKECSERGVSNAPPSTSPIRYQLF